MNPRRPFIAWLGALALGSSALAEPLPPDLRAGFMLRSLAYDRSIEVRAGSDLGLLILGKAGSEDADAVAENLAQAVGTITVSGLELRLERLDFVSVEQVSSFVQSKKIAVIYLASGMEGDSRALATSTSEAKVTLIAADGADLPNGCSLGFKMVDGRPTIVVDTARAEAAAMEPDQRLLKAAEIVGD